MPNLYSNYDGLFKLNGVGWSPKPMIKQSKPEYVRVARDSYVKKKSMARLPRMVNRSCAECPTKSKYWSIVRRNHFLYNRGILNKLFRIKFDD
jgi:hypothetical protein